MRHDGRKPDQLRELDIEPDYLEQPHGSVLYAQGKTIVLCTATVEEGVPRWLSKSGRGWMTAEYAMLPASTGERTQRAVSRGRPDGRTVEIQRLIGRALRSVCDFEALGERTLWLDCDVLQADGGTRCASITGAWIAARRALDRFGLSKALTGSIAAVSVGIVAGEAVLDLDYEEDSGAETDMNVVMTGDGRLVEVQATAERDPFSRELLDSLLDLAAGGIEALTAAQAEAAAAPRPRSAGSAAPRVRNPNKLRELRAALPDWEIVLLDSADEPVEDGATFLDNARIKARHGRGACSVRGLGRRGGLRDRGGRARWPTRGRVRALGRGRRRAVARRARRRARPQGPVRLRARRAVARWGRAPSDGDARRGDRGRTRGATRGSATTRSSFPPASRGRSPSSGTHGRRSTRTVRRRHARSPGNSSRPEHW